MHLKSAPFSLIACTAALALLAGAYILLAGQVSAGEALAALPALAAALLGAALHHRHAQRRLTIGAPWGRLARTVTVGLARETVTVGAALMRALARPLTGKIIVQPFAPGNAGAASAGRRAAVILATSLAPNAYVVRVTQEALLMHQLVPVPDKTDTTWPL